MWVADFGDDKLYAYKMSDKSRDSGEDFSLHSSNEYPNAIWSNGTTMWVTDSGDDKVYAYQMSDKSRDSGKDFDTLDPAGNRDPRGLWSDGTTMWVTDTEDKEIYAYKMSDKSRDSGKDFDTLDAAGNDSPRGIWSDGTTMWVVDSDDDKVYAYKMSDESRDSGKEFDLHSENTGPYGIWSYDRATMWVADRDEDKLYAYNLPAAAAAPTIRAMAVISTPMLETDTYGAGETIEVSVTFSEAVTATSDTDFELNVSGDRSAPLLRGSGTATLVFGYTVVSSDDDDNGIWIGNQDRTLVGARRLMAQSGTIASVATGTAADLTHAELGTAVGPQGGRLAVDRLGGGELDADAGDRHLRGGRDDPLHGDLQRGGEHWRIPGFQVLARQPGRRAAGRCGVRVGRGLRRAGVRLHRGVE